MEEDKDYTKIFWSPLTFIVNVPFALPYTLFDSMPVNFVLRAGLV